MARMKKDGHFLNCKLPDKILDRLSEYTQKTRIPKTAVVEIALTEYLDKMNPETEQEKDRSD